MSCVGCMYVHNTVDLCKDIWLTSVLFVPPSPAGHLSAGDPNQPWEHRKDQLSRRKWVPCQSHVHRDKAVNKMMIRSGVPQSIIYSSVGGLSSLVSVSRNKVFGGDFPISRQSDWQTDGRHTLSVANGPLHDQLHILSWQQHCWLFMPPASTNMLGKGFASVLLGKENWALAC